jgi:hypothetical protein
MTSATASIRAKIAAHALPSVTPLRAKVGMGNGRACSGCDSPIDRTQTQWELEFAGGVIIWLHRECERAWRRETRQ